MKNAKLDSPNGATPLDDISDLIPDHITTQQELNALEFANINDAMKKYFLKTAKPESFPMSLKALLQVHQDMFGKVWQWAGQPRQRSLNLGVEPLQIQTSLYQLLENFRFWIKEKIMEPMEIAARLHHELVRMHPFPNGNGRWARFLTNLYLRSQHLPMLQWPEEKLKDNSPLRQNYIQALKEADQGDLSPLIELQRKWLENTKPS